MFFLPSSLQSLFPSTTIIIFSFISINIPTLPTKHKHTLKLMAYISQPSIAGLTMVGLRSLDSGSSLAALTPCTNSPSSPSPTSPDSTFTEHIKRRPVSPSSKDEALFKVALSFFLSPAGYSLLRRDSLKRTKNKDTHTNQSTEEPVTKPSTLLRKSLVDLDEYTEWFK